MYICHYYVPRVHYIVFHLSLNKVFVCSVRKNILKIIIIIHDFYSANSLQSVMLMYIYTHSTVFLSFIAINQYVDLNFAL